jgi:small subunit ribosomal protein S15
MAVYLPKEKKAEIFEKFGGAAKNTGSTEGQIALFTYRITSLSEHLKKNHKDHATTRSLLKLVGKRKDLLTYLAKKDLNKYRSLIQELGIRDVLK